MTNRYLYMADYAYWFTWPRGRVPMLNREHVSVQERDRHPEAGGVDREWIREMVRPGRMRPDTDQRVDADTDAAVPQPGSV